MATSSNNRKYKRFYHKIPIMVEDNCTGYRFPATMRNHSDDGLYFESDYALRPERKVRIKIQDSTVVSKIRSHDGVVKWRKPLNKNSPHQYGSGVKYR